MGILFHLCWTGELPGTDGEDYVCAAVLKGKKPKLSSQLPGWLDALISQMLQLDPNKRPDMKDVMDALQKRDDNPPLPPEPSGFHEPSLDDM